MKTLLLIPLALIMVTLGLVYILAGLKDQPEEIVSQDIPPLEEGISRHYLYRGNFTYGDTAPLPVWCDAKECYIVHIEFSDGRVFSVKQGDTSRETEENFLRAIQDFNSFELKG